MSKDDITGLIVLGAIIVGAWYFMSGGTLVPPCNEGAIRCDQGIVKVCDDGVWKSTGFPC